MKKALLFCIFISSCAFNNGYFVAREFYGKPYNIPVYDGLDLGEAESAVSFVQTIIDENEYIMNVSTVTSYVVIRTHVGIPNKNQAGKAGPSYYLRKTESGWEANEPVTWIE